MRRKYYDSFDDTNIQSERKGIPSCAVLCRIFPNFSLFVSFSLEMDIKKRTPVIT